jgi:hypothetical protein
MLFLFETCAMMILKIIRYLATRLDLRLLPFK